MKILITGGAGYIGSHTLVELSNAGYEFDIKYKNPIKSKNNPKGKGIKNAVINFFKAKLI